MAYFTNVSFTNVSFTNVSFTNVSCNSSGFSITLQLHAPCDDIFSNLQAITIVRALEQGFIVTIADNFWTTNFLSVWITG